MTIDKQHVKDYEILFHILIEIFTFFINLADLSVVETLLSNRVRLSFFDPPPATFFSSSLLKLNIKAESFEDCLFVLDGRFNQLQTLHIDLCRIFPPHGIENQVSFTRKVPHYQRKNSICLRTKSLI